jgi:hypothetical protein
LRSFSVPKILRAMDRMCSGFVYDDDGLRRSGSVPYAEDASIALKRQGDLRMGRIGVNQAARRQPGGKFP